MSKIAAAVALTGMLVALWAVPPASAAAQPTSAAADALSAAVAAFQPQVRMLQGATGHAHEHGHGHWHGPTEQLAAVAVLRGELDEDGRLLADALAARPSDKNATDAPGVRYDGPTTSVDTTNFRVHHTTSGSHAATPAFARQVADVMEATRRTQVQQLGWAAPPGDGRRGGDARTDVYLADVASLGFLGYAATDPGQSCTNPACSGFHGYVVIDRAFAGWSKPAEILRVVAAHEYNHLLQFGYTALADGWWMEATAEWMAVHAEPHIDHTSSRMAHWGRTTQVPLTDASPHTGGQVKSYGSYVWNAWLAQRHGPNAVRGPWEQVAGTGPFSVDAYDSSLRGRFAAEFVEFAAATSEWAAAGIPRGERFADVARAGDLRADGRVVLDHTAYALYDVPARGQVTVTVSTPDTVVAGVGLIVRSPGGSVETRTAMLEGGAATVTADTTAAERVTVAVVNADARWTSAGAVWDHAGRRFSADGSAFTVTVASGPTAATAPAAGPRAADRLDGGGAQDPVGQAIATSQALFADGTADRVVLATADRFPDALAGSALAGTRGPILFTPGLGGLDPRVAAEIARVTGGRGQALVLGGTAAVSEQAAQEARAAAGSTSCSAPIPTTCRFAGTGREHTAALVAEAVLAENPGVRVLVARSDDFADAVTGGAYAAVSGTPVLLTPPTSLSPHTADLITRAGITEAFVLGGSAAVSDTVLAALPVAVRTRIAGTDRNATAAQIASRLWLAEGRGRGGALLVNVRHDNGWQTALSAAVASARLDAPQLGVENPPQGLPAATAAWLPALSGSQVRAVGNVLLVSEAQVDAARSTT